VTDPTGPRRSDDEDDHTTAPIPADLARELVAAASQINARLATGDDAATVPVSLAVARDAATGDDAATVPVSLAVAREAAASATVPPVVEDGLVFDVELTGETRLPAAPPAPPAPTPLPAPSAAPSPVAPPPPLAPVARPGIVAVPPSGVSAATAAALAALKPANPSMTSSPTGVPAVPPPTPSAPPTSVSSASGPPGVAPSTPQPSTVSTSKGLQVMAPSAGPAATGPAASATTAAALAALKSASSTTSGAGLSPAPRPTTNPTTPPARAPTRAVPTSEASALGPARPPEPLDTRPFKIAAAVGLAVIVVVGAIASRPAKVVSLPPIHLPVDAVDCRRVESEGTDLICVAAATSVNGLAADERARRITLTRSLATAAGFKRVVFREKADRVWRVEDLTLRPATTTDGAPPATP